MNNSKSEEIKKKYKIQQVYQNSPVKEVKYTTSKEESGKRPVTIVSVSKR